MIKYSRQFKQVKTKSNYFFYQYSHAHITNYNSNKIFGTQNIHIEIDISSNT